MKIPNKTLMALATTAAVVGPMVPKTVTINITEPPAHIAKAEVCSMAYTLITDSGRKVCEYKCDDRIILKSPREEECDKYINK
jgi:hypothetical protein